MSNGDAMLQLRGVATDLDSSVQGVNAFMGCILQHILLLLRYDVEASESSRELELAPGKRDEIEPKEHRCQDIPKIVSGISARPSYFHTSHHSNQAMTLTLSFCSDLEPRANYTLPFYSPYNPTESQNDNQTESQNDNQTDTLSGICLRPIDESNQRPSTLPCSDYEMVISHMQSLAF